MKPAFDRLRRRQFLLGAGGALLAIPTLPSMLPREARAQAMGAAQQRYFAHFATWHGAYQSQVFGSLLSLPVAATMQFGGHEIRRAALAATQSGGETVMSPGLRASSGVLTPRLLGLTNVINGLDFPTQTGHAKGTMLGAFNGLATIDQVLATSTVFYPTRVAMPAIVRNREISFTWQNPATRSGAVVETTPSAESNIQLFDRLFGNAAGPVLAVDRVREHARSVLSDPQCSTECRARLTQYLDMLASIQQRVAAGGPGMQAPRPGQDTRVLERVSGFLGSPSSHVVVEKLWNDVAVAAMAAGLTRVYVSGPKDYTFGPDENHSWHNNYAHGLGDPDKRTVYSHALRLQFEGAMLDLAAKMDAVRLPDGATLLDRALIANSHELGSGGDPGHHHNRCVPLITIGSAGGYFRTGQFLDYRNFTSFSFTHNQGDSRWFSGLNYQDALLSILRSMGVSPDEYMAGGSARTELPWLRA